MSTPAQPANHPTVAPTSAPPAEKRGVKRWVIRGVVILLVVAGLAYGVPILIESLNTVSTDDAYVNGHVTFVAPRVAGQVARVLVDDNNRVHKGDVIVELDRKPYQVQVDIAQAALTAANADLEATKAQTRAIQGQVRSLRFGL